MHLAKEKQVHRLKNIYIYIYIYGYQWGEAGGKEHIKNMGLGDTNYCV